MTDTIPPGPCPLSLARVPPSWEDEACIGRVGKMEIEVFTRRSQSGICDEKLERGNNVVSITSQQRRLNVAAFIVSVTLTLLQRCLF